MKLWLSIFIIFLSLSTKAMQLAEDINYIESGIQSYEPGHSEVLARYKKSKKEFKIVLGALTLLALPSFGMSLALFDEHPSYHRRYIYRLLDNASKYSNGTDISGKNLKYIKNMFNELDYLIKQKEIKISKKILFDDYIGRLKAYIDMPINDPKKWQKKSYKENYTELLMYLFDKDGQYFYKDLEEQNSVFIKYT